MKRAVLTASTEAAVYLEQVREAEASLCAQAERIMVCSQQDTQRLQRLYGCVRSQTTLVPNGVDARAIRFATREARRANQCGLGLDRRLSVLFVRGWHQPNIEASGHLKRIAQDCPEADFLIVGSACGHAVLKSHADNLYPLGTLDDAELTVVTEAVDLAINPITTGSGTNLKMLQYATAGIPILTTEFGNRGLAFRPGEHLWQAPVGDFPAAIRRLGEGLKGKQKDEQIKVYPLGIDYPPPNRALSSVIQAQSSTIEAQMPGSRNAQAVRTAELLVNLSFPRAVWGCGSSAPRRETEAPKAVAATRLPNRKRRISCWNGYR